LNTTFSIGVNLKPLAAAVRILAHNKKRNFENPQATAFRIHAEVSSA